MPAVGQTTDEVVILEWAKAVGDSVAAGELLLLVQTDKAEVEVESPYAGILLAVWALAGDTVESGSAIGYVGAAGDVIPTAPAAAKTEVAGSPAPAASEAAAKTEVGGSPAPAAPEAASKTEGGGTLQRPGAASRSSVHRPSPRILPAARRLSKELGVALDGLTGSGPEGEITLEDVKQAAEGSFGQSAATSAGNSDVRTVGRSLLAARLTEAARVPQFHLTIRVHAGGLVNALASAREHSARITPTHILVRTVGECLTRFPYVNVLWDAGLDGVRGLTSANVGLAVAGDRGLQLVTIAEPASLQWPELAERVDGAISRARNGRLTTADMAEAALSVSNLGMFKIHQFDPLVDPRQTGMLGVGRLSDEVWAVDGSVTVRPTMLLTLAVDHRAVDGAPAAEFLDSLAMAIEALNEA